MNMNQKNITTNDHNKDLVSVLYLLIIDFNG